MTLVQKNKILITALFLLLVNLLLKMLFITQPSIAWDEPFTIYHAQMDASSIIRHLYNGNNPPGFELILHCWIKMFGIGPFAVRFLPCVFSSLTAMMLFLLGCKAFHYRTGLLTALIFTFSNFHLFFAHEARVYALFGFLAVTSVYFFILLMQTRKKRFFIGLTVVNAALMYCHYFGAFIPLIEGISVLVIARLRKEHFWRFVLSGVCTLFLFLPNIMILAGRFSDTASKGTWIEKPTGIVNLYNMLWNFSNQPLNTVICLVILFAALIKLLVLKDFRQVQTEKKIVAIWFLFPFFFMFGISWIMPIFLDRYLVFVSFGYYFLVAISLDYLFGKPIWKYAATSVLAVLFAVTFRPDLDNKRHVKETIAKVAELKDDNTSVIICDHDFVLNFAYYYDQRLFTDVDEEKVYEKMKSKLAKQDIFAVYGISPEMKLKPKVVFLDAAADFSNPTNNILNTLKQNYNLKSTHHYETVFNVYEFELK